MLKKPTVGHRYVLHPGNALQDQPLPGKLKKADGTTCKYAGSPLLHFITLIDVGRRTDQLVPAEKEKSFR